MKDVEPLLNRAITTECLRLGYEAESVDILSYKVGHATPTAMFLNNFKKVRLILGYFKDEDLTRIRAFVTACGLNPRNALEVRVIKDSHAKMFVFHGNPLSVIVGSCNILSKAYETGVLLRGKPAKYFATAFHDFWSRAWQVKPLDLRAAQSVLESSVFETKGSHSP